MKIFKWALAISLAAFIIWFDIKKELHTRQVEADNVVLLQIVEKTTMELRECDIQVRDFNNTNDYLRRVVQALKEIQQP